MPLIRAILRAVERGNADRYPGSQNRLPLIQRLPMGFYEPAWVPGTLCSIVFRSIGSGPGNDVRDGQPGARSKSFLV